MKTTTKWAVSIDDIKTASKAASAYGYRADWFGPGEMGFFNTRLIDGVYTNHHSRAAYFIASHAFDDSSPRRFSIHVAPLNKYGWPTGVIDTVGEHLAFETLADAEREVTRLWLETPNQ